MIETIKSFIASLLIVFSNLCTPSDSIYGIDVSHHQGSINWSRLSSSIQDDAFVYVKATEGSTYTDPMCIHYTREARQRGLLVGCYHYFRMTSGAREQYALYSSVLDKVGPDLLPMVDVETLDRKTVNELQDSLAVFLNLLEKDYGKKPMIYGTNYSYNKFCAPRFNKYPLYIGRYGDVAPVIRGVGTYTIWQYSDSTVLPGCKKPIDVCRFHKEKSLADILL